MRRRELLTYDLDQRRTALPAVSVRLIVLLVIILGMAAALATWTATSAGSSPGSAAAAGARSAGSPAVRQTAAPIRAAADPGSPRATTSPGAIRPVVQTGTDADTAGHAPEGSTAAVTRFVAAWLEAAPVPRKRELAQTCTSGLAEELMLTSAANIPKARAKGEPRLEDASPYSAQFVQALTDGTRIRIYLVADPQSRSGWLATAVEQV